MATLAELDNLVWNGSRLDLRNYLVGFRLKHGGSISPINHINLLTTWSTQDMRNRVMFISENQRRAVESDRKG